MASAFRMKPPMHGLGVRASHPLATGLVGYWPFWEGSGDRAMDVTQNGRAMTAVNGPIWTPSSRGQAMLFNDANSQYLSIDLAAVNAWPFSMTCWFNVPDITRDNVLMFVGDKDDTSYWSALWARGTIVNDPVSAFSHRYGAVDLSYAYSTGGYSADTWHHAAGVWTSASLRAAFLDGANKGTETTTVGAPLNHDRTVIGSAQDSSPDFYTSGMIGLAKIWNRALSDAEVLEDYQDPYALIRPPSTITTFTVAGMVPEQHPPPAAIRNYKMKPPMHGQGIRASHPLANGLVGYWPFWEGSGDRAMDVTQNGNTGTLTDGLMWSQGPNGGALDVDATDKYCETTFDPSARLGQNFTISTIALSRASTNFLGICGDHSAGTAGIIGGQWASGVWQWGYGTGAAFRTVNVSLSLDTWSTIVVVFRCGVGITAFVNGVRTYGATADAVSHRTVFSIGRAFAAASRYWDGQIDFLSVHDRAMTDSEALQFTADPYALIRPPSTITTFAGLAGGTTIRWPWQLRRRRRTGAA